MTTSPGAALSARALLERRVEREVMAALRVFLAGVAREARAAPGPAGLPLGVVLGAWADTSTRLLHALPELAPDQMARLAAHPLPERAYRSAQAVLTQAGERGWSASRTSRELGHALSVRTPTATTAPSQARPPHSPSGLGTEGESWASIGERLARTEATTAHNRAALAGAGAGERKRWVSRHDARTRPTHLAADGQTVPVEQTFLVGGYTLAYPGDPRGPMHETAGCRCVTVLVAAEGPGR